ncbi:uncharacterized protein N7459_009952 [Penicillium hispanicum]|uniref:uncharacterized protein n=1 Tax=Penicillium hispanicum TaxID=1080232 RepID=UPI00254076AE|nr:uncharacterized protein N7459_009952 [Penicillium hispanicum]KAJ5570522.1 hypothetical protein N7459_009952 [Penicillium hispanicum]
MSSQRYQRVNAQDEDDNSHSYPLNSTRSDLTPTSPPPSFRSRSSSPSSRRLLHDDPLRHHEDQTLADAFDDEGDSDDDDEPDDRQRLMRAHPDARSFSENSQSTTAAPSSSEPRADGQDQPQTPGLSRRPTILPSFTTPRSGGSRSVAASNDGVFANLAAKPERGEKNEDLPPSYEEAAADATPPYWETTIVAPGLSSDEVYVDGLPVGSVFSFVWNAMISMSFQLVGFLLTYLLHTTHAAKNGSRAGLGLTLVQYGFYMKGGSDTPSGDGGGSDQYVPPPDPNSHSFDPSSVGDSSGGGNSGAMAGISTSEWISYILMIVGWFILIRAVSDFLRARRHEQLVLQSPDRGLGVPVIAEGERSETVV